MKTMYVILGIAAVGGVLWYLKNKNGAASPGATVQDPAAATGVIPKPPSEASKIIKMPDSLLQNTTGNTGIMPPVIIGADRTTATIPIRQTPQKTNVAIQSNVVMKGFGDAFILN